MEYTNANEINRLSTAAQELSSAPPESFLDVLEEWGCTWLWDDMQLTGGTEWLGESISKNCLMAVTDGSFIRELLPDFSSACLIFECTQGRDRLIVIFAEHSAVANAYRGELLGLMSIHLLLLSVHRISPDLQCSVKIYSDCLGAMGRVADLPPNRIPTRCRHSDIVKTILVNCSGLPFSCIYEHVKAHQDDDRKYDTLLLR